MSNYTLNSPIQTKQINLYSAGGANALIISSPSTLVSNTLFPLPSTVGTTGQYLSYDASGSIWITPSNTSQLPISTTFYGSGGYSQQSTKNPTVVGSLYFPGTTTAGTPTAIYAIVGNLTGIGVSVQLFDLTNNVIIGTSTGITTTTSALQIVNIPITLNFSTSPSILDIRIFASVSGGVRIYFFQIVF